jgi:hypothetical protein
MLYQEKSGNPEHDGSPSIAVAAWCSGHPNYPLGEISPNLVTLQKSTKLN